VGARSDRVLYPSLVANARVELGSAGVPQLSVIAGDCEVTGQLSGGGIVVVDGLLHVSGELAFSGLLLARGGVVFDPGSRVEVRGAFWRAAGTDTRLELRGTAALLYSSAALAAVDAALPGVLPHAGIVVGWREQL
jgi:hypothetical protein